MAALKTGGQVVIWGDPDYGGDSTGSYLLYSPAGQPLASFVVVDIVPNLYSFAALTDGGGVVVWGLYIDKPTYYNSGFPTVVLESGVERVYANAQGGFSVVKKELSAVSGTNGNMTQNFFTWGYHSQFHSISNPKPHFGYEIGSDPYRITKVYSSNRMTIVRGIVNEGQPNEQVFVYSLERDSADPSLPKYFQWGNHGLSNEFDKVYMTYNEAAIIKANNELIFFGGTHVPVEFTSGVVKISTAEFAYAALKEDGSVATWGSYVTESVILPQGSLGVTSVDVTDAPLSALNYKIPGFDQVSRSATISAMEVAVESFDPASATSVSDLKTALSGQAEEKQISTALDSLASLQSSTFTAFGTNGQFTGVTSVLEFLGKGGEAAVLSKVAEAKTAISSSQTLSAEEKTQLSSAMDATEAQLQTQLDALFQTAVDNAYGTFSGQEAFAASYMTVKRQMVGAPLSKKQKHAQQVRDFAFSSSVATATLLTLQTADMYNMFDVAVDNGRDFFLNAFASAYDPSQGAQNSHHVKLSSLVGKNVIVEAVDGDEIVVTDDSGSQIVALSVVREAELKVGGKKRGESQSINGFSVTFVAEGSVVLTAESPVTSAAQSFDPASETSVSELKTALSGQAEEKQISTALDSLASLQSSTFSDFGTDGHFTGVTSIIEFLGQGGEAAALANISEAKTAISSSATLSADEKTHLSSAMDATEAQLQTQMDALFQTAVNNAYGTFSGQEAFATSYMTVKRQMAGAPLSKKQKHAQQVRDFAFSSSVTTATPLTLETADLYTLFDTNVINGRPWFLNNFQSSFDASEGAQNNHYVKLSLISGTNVLVEAVPGENIIITNESGAEITTLSVQRGTELMVGGKKRGESLSVSDSSEGTYSITFVAEGSVVLTGDFQPPEAPASSSSSTSITIQAATQSSLNADEQLLEWAQKVETDYDMRISLLANWNEFFKDVLLPTQKDDSDVSGSQDLSGIVKFDYTLSGEFPDVPAGAVIDPRAVLQAEMEGDAAKIDETLISKTRWAGATDENSSDIANNQHFQSVARGLIGLFKKTNANTQADFQADFDSNNDGKLDPADENSADGEIRIVQSELMKFMGISGEYGMNVFTSAQLKELFTACSETGRYSAVDISGNGKYASASPNVHGFNVLALRHNDCLQIKATVYDATGGQENRGNSRVWLIDLKQTSTGSNTGSGYNY